MILPIFTLKDCCFNHLFYIFLELWHFHVMYLSADLPFQNMPSMLREVT